MHEGQHRSGLTNSASSFVPILGAFAFAAATFFGVSARNDAAAEARVDRRAAQLDAALYPLGAVYLREFSLAGGDALGLDTATATVTTAARERETQRLDTLEQLDVLAQGDDDVADVAGDLASVIRTHEGEDGAGRSLDLWEEWMVLDEFGAEQGAFHSPERDALDALTAVALTPRLIVADMVDAEFIRLRPTLPPAAEAYFAQSEAYILDGEAGWLATDRDDPFSGELVPRDEVRRHLPEAESELTATLISADAQRLVQVDRWIIAMSDGPQGPPPLSIGRASAAVDRLDSRLAPIVADAFDGRVELADGAVARALWDRWLIAGVGAIAVLICLAAQAAAARRHRRHWFALAEATETDDLTGLANRRGLQRRVPIRLADPERSGHVLVQVDLDRFKAVNDTHGHQAGDAVLRAFANCARAVLEAMGRQPDDHELARIGGDEFLIVLHDCADAREGATRLIEALETALRRPVRISGVAVELAVSGGVAVATGPATFEELLSEADIALYQAKNEGHRGFKFFDEPLLREILRDFTTHAGRGAIAAHLQPQVDLETGEVVAYEALARWSRGDRSSVAAGEWISVVESMGAGDILFEAMARSSAEVLEQLGHRFAGRVWLNLAPTAIAGPGAAEALLATLQRAGLRPRRVGVELLETSRVADLDGAARNLLHLRDAGVEIALDDFGCGFTPIGHLTALPISLIKLDRSLIADVDRRPKQAALVAAMVTAVASLELGLIAEGIETEAELAALRSLGVRLGQGYLLGGPAPVEDFLGPTARAARGVPMAGDADAVGPPIIAPA